MSTNPKQPIRDQLLQARRTIDPARRSRSHQQIRKRLHDIGRLSNAGVVFCFVSMADEVDTHELITELQAQGKQIVVPGISADRRMAAYPLNALSELREGQLGILTPDMHTPWQGQVDISLTPGLGFSPAGRRLGFGRGYYDSWFAGHPDVYRVGLAYSCQILDEIPVDDHDVPMHMVVTEEESYECTA